MSTGPSASVYSRRRENLAFIFQEPLTAVVRLRSGRQAVSDANAFRAQIREAFKRAERDSRNGGYETEHIRLAVFAVVALLDESVLNLQHQSFAEWMNKPMQEELFGVHVAGEIFFDNIRRLLANNDSPELADILEIYLLCILLGYRGRYSMGATSELQTFVEALKEKIVRIRGRSKYLSPSWAPPLEQPKAGPDAWTRKLALIGAACLLLTLVLFIGFKLSLSSSVAAIEPVSAVEN